MNIKPLLTTINPSTFIHEYLSACGVKDIDKYLKPEVGCFDDPSLYININGACQRLREAVLNKQKVGILTDEDVDGLCSATIMYTFLKEQGVEPVMFFHNVSKAHGLREGSTEDLLPEILEAKLDLFIIPDASADVGTSKELHSNDVDTIIIDHHLIPNNNPYVITVNCTFQPEVNQSASGALVTSKVVDAYCDMYGLDRIDNTDLVGLSVVSDVMNFADNVENRAYMDKWIKEYEQNV